MGGGRAGLDVVESPTQLTTVDVFAFPDTFGAAFGEFNATRTNQRKQLPGLDKQGLPLGPDRTRGVVEHSKLQSKRSNPNARWLLGVRKEATHSPPNHGGDEFLTCPRQVTIAGQDLRLGGCPGALSRPLRGKY
jgi:hypothetical protein